MLSTVGALLAFCFVYALVAVAAHHSAVRCASMLGGRFKPLTERRPMTVGAALFEAVSAPKRQFDALVDAVSGDQQTQLAGPVAITRSVVSTDTGAWLVHVGMMAMGVMFAVPSVHLFDVLTFALFRTKHTTGGGGNGDTSQPNGFASLLRRVRLTRRYHATLVVLALCALDVISMTVFDFTNEGDSGLGATGLSVPATYCLLVLTPLLAFERWGRKTALVVALGSLLPASPVPFVLGVWLAVWARGELRRDATSGARDAEGSRVNV